MAKKSAKKASVSTSKSAPRLLPKSAKVTELETLGRHTYLVVYVPTACNDWDVGDHFEATVSEPPPASVAVDMGGACNPIYGMLDE